LIQITSFDVAQSGAAATFDDRDRLRAEVEAETEVDSPTSEESARVTKTAERTRT
jgi:hypothetical protein